MRVLIIEDDNYKAEQLQKFCSTELSRAECSLRRSFQSGLLAISQLHPTVVLLDMVLPNYDQTESDIGFEIRLMGGVDVLREVKREEFDTAVVVVTQFEDFGEGKEKTTLNQLDDLLRLEFPDHYIGAVYYHAKQLDWMLALRQLLQNRGLFDSC